MQDADQVIKWISGLGVSGVLILLVYGLLKGWFVTGREHSVLANLYTGLQADMTSMRLELNRLRDRDDAQQREINALRAALDESEKEKHTALERVEELTKENVGLRSRVAELERTVAGLNAGTRT